MERIPLLLRANSNNGDMSESSSSVESKREEEPPSNHNTASLILSLAIPALVGEIIDPLLTLADTAFVGRFAGDNNNAAALLAGLGSASAILTFSFYLFNFLCTATTPLISQRRAAGNDTQALTLSGQVLTLALLLGCLVTLILTVFSQPLLTLMGTSQTGPQANQYATSFLAIRAASVFLGFVIFLAKTRNPRELLALFVPIKPLFSIVRLQKIRSTYLSAVLQPEADIDQKIIVRVAFLGNSLQYFNDQPRFNEVLSSGKIQQNSCYCPHSNFVSLFNEGNGMRDKWNTTNALLPDGTFDMGAPNVTSLLGQQQWDFVVMNDYSQGPADPHNRTLHLESLQNDYAPLIIHSGATPVLLLTWAYREEGINDSGQMGGAAEFTRKLHDGYQIYARALKEILPAKQKPRIAPVGLAFYWIHEENYGMWLKLYHWDSMHPSPHGSFLEGCIIYCTIFGSVPPIEVAIPEDDGPASLWLKARARVMQPLGEAPLPRPTSAEAKYLWNVAAKHCTLNYIYDY